MNPYGLKVKILLVKLAFQMAFLGFETLKIDHHLWNVDIERGISTIEGFKG